MSTQVVLVPGFWLGAWAWDAVAPALREAGHDVVALTLPGLEPGADPTTTTLDAQADAVVAALDPAADRRVLVVHSGAAVPGTLVLDRRPDLVDHVVFVDTAPVRDGYAMDPELQGDTLALDAVWDDELAQGSMRDLTDDQLAVFRERAVPQPAGTVAAPVVLSNPARLSVPATVVCTAFPSEEYRSYADQGAPFLAGLLDHTDVTWVDLPTGHWPMWSRPLELATVLGAVADGDAPQSA